jgi:hypothetical protein
MAVFIQVDGFNDLDKALREIDLGLEKEMRAALLEIVEPIRRDAELLAVDEITGLHKQAASGDPKWSRMRVGRTVDGLYIAPKERGRQQGAGKRPQFGTTLVTKAMQPAFDRHGIEVDLKLEEMLDVVVREAGF